MNPTVGYVRVSREEQARGDRTSLEQQHDAITALAERLRLAPPEARFMDPGISGGTAEDRPGFMGLLSYCEAYPQSRKHPGYVLVLNDSRWGRFGKPAEAAYWRVVFEKHHGWIVRFAEADDTEDPMASELMRTIHSVQATAYREQIKQNAKRGARGTAQQGYWQNEAPMGYRRFASEPGRPGRLLDVGQRKGQSERVRLAPGPESEQQLVRWMFETYARGGTSLGGMARELSVRYPDRRWSRPTVRQVLMNATYLGDVIWGRRPHDKLERLDGVRPREEWVIAQDAHPALIDRDLFDRVQARLRANKSQLRRSGVHYLLSGLVRCAQCGEPYIGGGGPAGPPGDEDRYRFYRDRGSDALVEKCLGPIGTMPRRVVEPWLVRTIGQVVGDPVTMEIAGEELDRLITLSRVRQAGGRVTGADERQRLVSERERLVTAIANGTLIESEARVRLTQIRTQLDRQQGEEERERFAGRRLESLAVDAGSILAQAQDFEGSLAQLAPAQQRDLLAEWLESAVMDKFTRTLTITIRRVPALGLLSCGVVSAGADQSLPEIPRLIVTRKLRLPKYIARPRRKA